MIGNFIAPVDNSYEIWTHDYEVKKYDEVALAGMIIRIGRMGRRENKDKKMHFEFFVENKKIYIFAR